MVEKDPSLIFSNVLLGRWATNKEVLCGGVFREQLQFLSDM